MADKQFWALTEKTTDAVAADQTLIIDSEDSNIVKRISATKYKWPQWETWDTGATWDTWAKWDTWDDWAKGDTWDTWPQWPAWDDWIVQTVVWWTNITVDATDPANPIVNSDLGVDWEQIYYVGKNWNDSNDWLTTDKAFLTWGAAITEATAQTPTSTNSFVLYCDDRGIYTEDVVLPAWVDMKATSAFIDWSLTVADNQSVRICTVDKIIKTTWTWQSYVDACRIKTPDTETWVLNSSTWSLIMKARRIDAPLNWIGINNTSTWVIHCDVNSLVLEWNNAIWVQSDWGEIIGSIEAIWEEWTPTTTTALKVVTWHIDANSSEIVADTAYNIAAGVILTLQVGHLEGTKTVANWWDAQISEASKSTDELAATWLVNWAWEVTINTDTTKLDITPGSYYIQGTKYVYAWWTAVTPTIGAWDSSTWVWFDSSWVIYSTTSWTTVQTKTILPLSRLQAEQWESWPWSNLQSPIDLRFIISENWYLQRDWNENAIWVLYKNWGTYIESSTALQVDQSAWVFYDPQTKPLDITADTDIEASALYHISWSWDLQTRATLVTPLYYDDWTDIAALPVNKWASHTLLRAQKEEDSFILVYSPAIYDSEAEAEAAWIYYWLFGSQASWFTAVANIIIKGSSGNIDSIADRRPFVWGTSPWVIGTATMQQTYDNSSNPEVLTDATRWAITVKRWSAADTDCIFEWQNWAWSQTFCVDWNWDVTASWDITWNNLSWTNTWDQTTVSWNAWTATALETARTIWWVSFDWTANIDLPWVNTAWNQNTSWTAANVTWTVAIANWGTWLSTLWTVGQVLAVNTWEDALEYVDAWWGSVWQTTNQSTLLLWENVSAWNALAIEQPQAIDQSQTTDDNDVWSYSTGWNGQTFTTGSWVTTVSSVDLKIFREWTVTDFTVSIRATSWWLPTWADLWTVVYDASSLSTSATEVNFKFSSPVSVSASTQYAIVWRSAWGDASNEVRTRRTWSVYGWGSRMDSSNSWSSWTANTSQDFWFKSYYVSWTATIIKADASDSSWTLFVWFATGAWTSWNSVNIWTSWVDTNQSWLTPGDKYYLSDTAWDISNTPWTVSVECWKALSATEILINTFW